MSMGQQEGLHVEDDTMRAAIMGSINIVQTCGQSLGPLVNGVLADKGLFSWSFVLAGFMKAM